ncbi:MAG: hypothetical protein R2729_19155 [Bryobacteraceae bacterium]
MAQIEAGLDGGGIADPLRCAFENAILGEDGDDGVNPLANAHGILAVAGVRRFCEAVCPLAQRRLQLGERVLVDGYRKLIRLQLEQLASRTVLAD